MMILRGLAASVGAALAALSSSAFAECRVVQPLPFSTAPSMATQLSDNVAITGGCIDIDDLYVRGQPVLGRNIDPARFDPLCDGRTTQSQIDDGTAHDCAPAINAAAAERVNGAALNIQLRPGNYYIADAITIGAGQCLIGAGRGLTSIRRNDAFSASAPGGIVLTGREQEGPCVRDLSLIDTQPDDQAVRANFADLGTCTSASGGTGCRYSPAIYISTANRFKLQNLGFQRVWDGIVNAPGNPTGGFFIDTIEMGALNRGMWLDQIFDFGHIYNFHFWNFGISGAIPLRNVYDDGATIAAQFGTTGTRGGVSGAANGLSIVGLTTWRGRVQVYNDDTWISFSDLELDGDNASLEVYENNAIPGGVRVNGLYVTGTSQGANTNCRIDIKSGNRSTKLVNAYINGSSAGNNTPALCVAGGAVDVVGSTIVANSVDQTAVLQTGGALLISGSRFGANTGAGAFTVPLFTQTGGSATIIGNRLGGPPMGGSVPAFSFTDTTQNYVADNMLSGWTPVDASLGKLGYYDFGDYAFPITITHYFDSNGDFVPGNVSNAGSFFRRGNFADFEFASQWDNNAYTTASGAFILETNIPAFVGTGQGCIIHLTTRVTAVGTPTCYATAAGGVTRFSLARFVSGGAPIPLDTAGFPASVAAIRIQASGRIRIR